MAYRMLKNSAEGHWRFDAESLEGAALAFLRESCEDLRFDADMARREREEQTLFGVSGTKKIPYNEQMDVDRLCLENAVRRFFASGRKENAFDVYFCYLEMFVGDYEKTSRMIELLSEFENNGGGLLMKHRDHYSHSVYVFLLGLAVYETDPALRSAYCAFMRSLGAPLSSPDGHDAAGHFLEYWGMTSLFHDIGYPFELPFEQVESYFAVETQSGEKPMKDKEIRAANPYLAYSALERMTALDADMAQRLSELLGTRERPESTNALFAMALSRAFSGEYGVSRETLQETLQSKPGHPERFNYFMDHGWFSATVLFRKLFGELRFPLRREHIEALTAILLHNSLYKFTVARYKEPGNKPLRKELHPLAWLLMLCDELQCWDRTAYGRNSRLQCHPFGCTFRFRADALRATYLYDERELSKFNRFKDDYVAWLSGERKKEDRPELKAYSEMYIRDETGRSDFQKDIEQIVDLRDYRLEVDTETMRNRHCGDMSGLSNSNFLNLYRFALVLNGRWSSVDAWRAAKAAGREDEFVSDPANRRAYTEDFKRLSLEYKLSNINQAKAFSRLLERIGCFYSDRDVDYEIVDTFTVRELEILGPLEHHRWLQEHQDMGWAYGEKRDEAARLHPDMVPGLDPGQTLISEEQARQNHRRLNKEEQDKDTEPMECMLAMLRMFDGLRIYRLQ